MARDAEGKLGKFTAQNMSNTLLAYAKLEHHPGHLMEVMAAEALRKLDSFTPQVLNLLFSHTRLGDLTSLESKEVKLKMPVLYKVDTWHILQVSNICKQKLQDCIRVGM